ncbi:hypothetical protein BD413DRAFT_560355 [Trametes elegans]|nr:hypothetical protein BD413DRAFT_560355 [Trametes elegans]
MKSASKRKTTQRKIPYEKAQKKATKRRAPPAKSRAANAPPTPAAAGPLSIATGSSSLPSASPSPSSSSSARASSSLSSVTGSSSSSPHSPPSVSPLNNVWGFEVARDSYVEAMTRFYPNITPRHEYDVLQLGSHYQKGTTEEVFAWVDSMLAQEIGDLGSREAVFEATKKTLNTLVDCPTGRKPRPGRDRVDIRPIPDSEYSIRLWPGSRYASEYCMDFVDSETKQPVNSPFEFELWGAPNPEAPWLCAPAGRLLSLERSFGIPQHKIRPGEEKFVLRDGMTCLLKRRGKKDIQFTVPMRRRPLPQYDVHILDFPKTI